MSRAPRRGRRGGSVRPLKPGLRGCVDEQVFCKFTANSAVGHGPGTNQTSSYVPGIVGACQVFVAPYLDWPVATHNNSFFAKHFEHVVYRIEYIRRTWTDHRIY